MLHRSSCDFAESLRIFTCATGLAACATLTRQLLYCLPCLLLVCTPHRSASGVEAAGVAHLAISLTCRGPGMKLCCLHHFWRFLHVHRL
ncbi:hypothetical protein BCR44DRAFT_1111583 [Catenaria anguillulae PL171]|uniref:Uncharacterized protein n=1 Tax=Catenaria anguillulae PL171 TaxID=765915 RepID=A0A1Y2H4C6_9FUNG|nr:hypothetical protein BCR44DRAFT_1111583 [Catenaria anguillulae PL171]